MGLQRTIRFPNDSRPQWESVRLAFARVSESPVVRMIDDLPAFPDEIPEPGWRELRLSLTGGMVTLRSTPGGWDCVIWGNAEVGLLKSWNAACWAVAEAGKGSVVLDDGALGTAGEFRERLPLDQSF